MTKIAGVFETTMALEDQGTGSEDGVLDRGIDLGESWVETRVHKGIVQSKLQLRETGQAPKWRRWYDIMIPFTIYDQLVLIT